MSKTLIPKKPLTEEQLADAARLMGLWHAWQDRCRDEGRKPLTQGEMGYRYDLGSQGMVWQYLNGRAPLNLKAAMAFAVAMDCSVEDISPSLSVTAQRAAGAVTRKSAPLDDDLSALRTVYLAIAPERRTQALSAATSAMIAFLSPNTSAAHGPDALAATPSVELPAALDAHKTL